MNRRPAIALLALVAAGASCRRHETPAAPTPSAQAADPWSAPAPKKDPLPHPLLWAIEKDGMTSYALGTMHLGVDPEERLPDLVWNKLDQARTLAVETDLTDPSVAKMVAGRPEGGTLHEDLGDAYWKKLEDALSPRVAEQLDRMRPMIAVTMLSTRGLPSTPAMDSALVVHAEAQHKPLLYLEPATKQIALLVKWMDVRALEEMLDELPVTERMQKEMLAAYLAGDDAKIAQLGVEDRALWLKHGRSAAEFDQMMKEMLYDRNASWIDELEHMHASGGGFIAVGALHLVGEHSVLDLLRHRGYKVTRLTP
jgi:uncharacterized protein YbaP (TraB family)